MGQQTISIKGQLVNMLDSVGHIQSLLLLLLPLFLLPLKFFKHVKTILACELYKIGRGPDLDHTLQVASPCIKTYNLSSVDFVKINSANCHSLFIVT